MSITETLTHHYRPIDDVSLVSRAVNGFPAVTYDYATQGTFIAKTRSSYDANGLVVFSGDSEPRWDYDPTTGAFRGLRMEKPSSNECAVSEDVEGSNWSNTGTLATVVAATGPDGETSAQTIQDDDAGASSRYTYTRTSLSGASETWTESVFIDKDAIPAATRFVAFELEFSGGTTTTGQVTLDTSTGETSTALVTGSGTVVAGRAQNIANARWRLSLTFTNAADAANTTAKMHLYPAYGANADLTTQDVTVTGNPITVAFFQLEEQWLATAYISTNLAVRTRLKDEVTLTGADAKDWWSGVDGIYYIQLRVPDGIPLDGKQKSLVIHRNSAINYMAIAQDLDTPYDLYGNANNNGSEDQVHMGSGVDLSSPGVYRIAYAFSDTYPAGIGAGRQYVYVNGVGSTVDETFVPVTAMASGGLVLYLMSHPTDGEAWPDLVWLEDFRFYRTTIATDAEQIKLAEDLSNGIIDEVEDPPAGGGGSGAASSGATSSSTSSSSSEGVGCDIYGNCLPQRFRSDPVRDRVLGISREEDAIDDEANDEPAGIIDEVPPWAGLLANMPPPAITIEPETYGVARLRPPVDIDSQTRELLDLVRSGKEKS